MCSSERTVLACCAAVEGKNVAQLSSVTKPMFKNAILLVQLQTLNVNRGRERAGGKGDGGDAYYNTELGGGGDAKTKKRKYVSLLTPFGFRRSLVFSISLKIYFFGR